MLHHEHLSEHATSGAHTKTRGRARLLPILGLVSGALCCPTAAENAPTAVEIHGPAGDSSDAVQVSASDIKFLPVEGKPGIYSANIAGSPGKAGIYVVLVRMDKGGQNAPHTHPDGRMTTVISGRVAYGIGKRTDLAAAKIYSAGSYYYTPPNVPHFLLAIDSDVVYQEVGFGPSSSPPVKD